MSESIVSPYFRTVISQGTFIRKYSHELCEDWPSLAHTAALDVCQDFLSAGDKAAIRDNITRMKFIPGGRYLYYVGRPYRFYNNCFLLKAEEDSREDWAALLHRSSSCLLTGGGIGIDYSVYRERGRKLAKTGGEASGPIALMLAINENGRQFMQGGSRRSAIYASLNWLHPDVYNPDLPVGQTFMCIKDWDRMAIEGAYNKDGQPFTVADAKRENFNYAAPLDMTNISPNYDTRFLEQIYGTNREELLLYIANGGDLSNLQIENLPEVYLQNVKQALRTGEPGFSFNFFDQEDETLRNACTEVTSRHDSDVCNLASMHMGAFDNIDQFADSVELATKFLVCGTLRAHLPYEKIYKIRELNRRLGLGLMGVHEWLLKRGYRYEVVPELHQWLSVYKEVSDKTADTLCDRLGISRPVAKRAIAPTGTIGMLAGTTTGIEPLFAVAFKRRFLDTRTNWKHSYVIDGTAKVLINEYGLKPDDIETSLDLAKDPERRIKFQYDVQKYVDQSISSTINLPEWGTPLNNESGVERFARMLAKYAHGLRGMTVYPDGSRGGQPLTPMSYYDALSREGEVFEETVDICDLSKGGHCGS